MTYLQRHILWWHSCGKVIQNAELISLRNLHYSYDQLLNLRLKVKSYLSLWVGLNVSHFAYFSCVLFDFFLIERWLSLNWASSFMPLSLSSFCSLSVSISCERTRNCLCIIIWGWWGDGVKNSTVGSLLSVSWCKLCFSKNPRIF